MPSMEAHSDRMLTKNGKDTLRPKTCSMGALRSAIGPEFAYRQEGNVRFSFKNSRSRRSQMCILAVVL